MALMSNRLAIDFLTSLEILIISNVELLYYLGIYIIEEYYYNFSIFRIFIFISTYLFVLGLVFTILLFYYFLV